MFKSSRACSSLLKLEERNPSIVINKMYDNPNSEYNNGSLNNNSNINPSNRDILFGVNERINRAEVIARESEVIATDTLDELANQRETLTRTRNRLTDANTELNTTNSALKSIHRRLASNKILLAAIILMELIIIGCQLYLKFFK